jgi:single-strand DNA-binding protein
MMNLVLLRGTLSSAPKIRQLPSGDELGQFEVTTGADDGKATIPVVLFNPATALATLEAGDEVVVTGTVRRRFFRQGAITRSSTEVVADRLVPGRQLRRADQAVSRALAALGTGRPSPS